MRYISELIDEKKAVEKREGSVVLPGRDRTRKENRVNLIALGDVGGTVLMGLRLLGGDVISSIGIYDLNENVVKRYEMEINQICFPDVRSLPEVTALEPGSESLYDCDMLVFCATKGVPPVTTAASATAAGGAGHMDVRMIQLEANGELVSMYASEAVKRGFSGIFAVVSDPVDPLCAIALKAGLEPEQIQGYGLGVMNGRASYHARRHERFARYLSEGRAFGPHGEDLVIADSVTDGQSQHGGEGGRLQTVYRSGSFVGSHISGGDPWRRLELLVGVSGRSIPGLPKQKVPGRHRDGGSAAG